MKHAAFIFLGLGSVFALASPSFAQTNSSPILGLESVKIVKGWRRADGSHTSAAHFKLEKGWKTYWRVAGAGGIPPHFDFSDSKNIASVSYHWPSPKVFEDYGIKTIGFQDELILPFTLTPKNINEPIFLDATVDFGVCEDVCVPVQQKLTANLSARVKTGKSIIEAALKKKALTRKQAGITNATCSFKPVQRGMEISAEITRNTKFHISSLAIVEYPHDNNSWMNQGAATLSDRKISTTATLYTKSPLLIDRSKIRITVVSQKQAVEIIGCTAS